MPTSSQIHRHEESKGGSDFDVSPSKATSRHVGLENKTGENNCFLNATIQALWHLNLFREKVLYGGHTGGEENIDLLFAPEQDSLMSNGEASAGDTLAAFCSLFTQYQFTENDCIPSSEIRRESLCFLCASPSGLFACLHVFLCVFLNACLSACCPACFVPAP